MRNVAKSIVKGLFVIVLFTGGSIALSTTGVKAVNEASAAVSSQQVTQYLVGLGYQVIALAPTKGSLDWDAHTSKGGIEYRTHIYVVGTQIVDHTDVPL